MSKPRIVLADDHKMFAEGVRHLLEGEYDVEYVVHDGATLVSIVKKAHPDVVVVDISMPGLNGIEAAREILERAPDTKIVILTMHEDVSYALAAFDAGVHGYVLKHSEPGELLKALAAVREGGSFVTPSIAGEVLAARRRGHAEESKPLTLRQREVLRLLVEGLTAKEIAARLSLSRKTVEYHKYQMRERLGVRSTAELVQYAVRRGYAAPL